MKFKLCNYFDVWGNKKEGYEVNNWCYEKDENNNLEHSIEDDKTTDKHFLDYLKDLGFLKKRCRLNMFYIERLGEMEIWNEKRTMKPIFCIEYMH